MGGFGRSLVRALAGAAQGYGTYLQGEGTRRLQDERDTILAQRAAAQQRLQTDESIRLAKEQSTLRKQEISHQGVENRFSNLAGATKQAEIDATKDAREAAQEAQRDAREYTQSLGLKDRELSNAKELEVFRAGIGKELVSAEGIIDAETGTKVLQFRDSQGNITNVDTGVKPQRIVKDAMGNEVDPPAPTKKRPPGTFTPGEPVAAPADAATAPASAGPTSGEFTRGLYLGGTGEGAKNPRLVGTLSLDKDLPLVRTPAEARKLPSGTRFRTPDGRVKVAP